MKKEEIQNLGKVAIIYTVAMATLFVVVYSLM